MKSRFINLLIKRRIGTLLILILVATIISVFIGYRETGVVANIQKKLPIYSVQTKDKRIAITFDVNWGNDNTEEILNILEQYNVKATFFVIGKWADEHPDLIKKISEKGHEIGNHSNSHPMMTKL